MKFYLFLLLFVTACSHSSGYKGHGSESVDPKTLKKFAPKPLPSGELERIEAMLDVRAPGHGLLSPNGKKLYFGWGVTGIYHAWKLEHRGAFPVQMTGGQDATYIEGITPDGKNLILSRDNSGDEYYFLYLQSVQGGPLKLIAGQEKVKTNFAFVSDDSKFLYYTMNMKEPTLRSLYKVNLKTGKSTLVFEGVKGYMYVTDWRKNGDILLGNATGNISREYYLYNENTKKLTPLLGQGEEESYTMAFSRKTGEYLVRTDKFGEYQRLYLYKNGDFTPLTKNMAYNVTSFSIDKTRSRILYGVNKDGFSEVHAMSAKSYQRLRTPFPMRKNVLHVYHGLTTPNGRYTVFSLEKVNSPKSSYVYDWRTGKARQWVFPSSPEIDTRDFVAQTIEHYTARDGTEIPMLVRRPQQCKNKVCPVIVTFHGGPESQSKPFFSPIAQLYLEEGFVLVHPNVRGSSGYSKTWLHSDNGPKRLDVITDIEDAALYIKKNWSRNGVVPKIGVKGGSYGGYSTNMAMTLFAGAYDAGVSVVGMSDLRTFLENTGPYRRHLRVSEYGDPDKDMEALTKLSPVTYLDRIQDPMLIVHGATDPRVPAGEAIQLYTAMEKKGLESELILFADEGHGVRKRKNQAIYIGHTLAFFKKHLKPMESKEAE